MALIGCPECKAEVSSAAASCPKCGHPIRAEAASPLSASPTIEAPKAAWNPGVAAVLSLVIPGAGQMYKGKVGEGVLWLFFTVGGYFLFILPGLIAHIVCVFNAASKSSVPESTPLPPGTGKCYFCAEIISRDAKICRHCQKPNHPVYHGPWYKIREVGLDGALHGSKAKPGDAFYQYDGSAVGVDDDLIAKLTSKSEGGLVVVTLVRDAEELPVEIPGGRLGVSLSKENIPA